MFFSSRTFFPITPNRGSRLLKGLERFANSRDPVFTAAVGGLFLLLVVGTLTFRHYGVTWDEEFHKLCGEAASRWYQSSFSDKSYFETGNCWFYGPVFDIVANSVAGIVPVGAYEGRHFLNFLIGLIAIVYVFRIGSYLGGSLTGVLAAAFLVLTPRFYGHIFNNPKDIPFASAYIIAIHYLFRCREHLPHPPVSLSLKLGAAMGFALGIRIGGILLVPTMALFLLLSIVESNRRGDSASSLKRTIVSTVLWAGFVCLIAWTVMILLWPYAQQHLLNPYWAMRYATQFGWGGEVFFGGTFVNAKSLPWTYLPTWLVISLPEPYFLALAGAGCLLAWRAARKSWSEFDATKLAPIVTLIFAFVFPISVAIVKRAVLYDGLRHFLFVIPPLAVLAGFCLKQLVSARHLPRSLRSAAGTASIIGFIIVLIDMVQLHPYQSIYFNRMVAGGLPRASQRFETDYWGASHKEAVEWLKINYLSTLHPLKVGNCSIPFLTGYYLAGAEDRFVQGTTSGSDIFFSTTRGNCHQGQPGRIIHTVTRQRVPLLYVFDRSQLAVK